MNNWGSYCSCSSVCREQCLPVVKSVLAILAESIFHVFQGYLPLELMSVQKNLTADRHKQNGVFSLSFSLSVFSWNCGVFCPSPLENICAGINNNGRWCNFWKPLPEGCFPHYSSHQWHTFFFVSILPVCCLECARWVLMPGESHLLKLIIQENVLLNTVRHNSSQSATYSAKFISKLLGAEKNH